jgi:acid phosphatase type 7
VKKSLDEHPDARFYILADDLVTRGVERDNWDTFFNSARDVFDRRPLVPTIGNHERQGRLGPWMYLRLFTLPESGPMRVAPETAYSFRYGNALIVVLNSNALPEEQSAWLEGQLKSTDAA